MPLNSHRLLTQIVLSPAGSGKTERLARRYIDLLKAGVAPERILTITFTEKAAAEMKERIFRILRKEDPELERRLKEKILKLRITTIDSFCLSLLKTFAYQLNLVPDLEVERESEMVWNLSSYDTLLRIAQERGSSTYLALLELISDGGFRGWGNLFKLFTQLFLKRLSVCRVKEFPETGSFALPPEILERLNSTDGYSVIGEEYPLIFPKDSSPEEITRAWTVLERYREKILTQKGEVKVRDEKKREWYLAIREYYYRLARQRYSTYFRKIFEIFDRHFLRDYTERKKKRGLVDFADLEIYAYRLLRESAGWENVLYIFDRHTDHILVDEFQDTSFLQWALIAKLSEEWRSGKGASVVRDIRPTLFLVGDDKQSIYLFRNAQSEIFSRAREKLESFLGKEFSFETIRDNYRSLSSIIQFTNYFFSRLFTKNEEDPAWRTRYSEFFRRRNNEALGKVEIIIDKGTLRIEERRKKEAQILARRISTLLGEEVVYDKEERRRKAEAKDFALLLRRRTHLPIYEKALSDSGIPYVVVKGIGFYDEPEVRTLLSLINFLTEPTDDFSLYCLLKSLFLLPESEILITQMKRGESLLDKVKRYKKEVGEEISSYLAMANRRPLSFIIEEVLKNRKGWLLFSAQTRYYNVKKFIRICENLEWEGKGLLEIREYFERAKENADEPKADVATETLNCVRIMTVHAAKGLEFPIVIFAGLDEDLLLEKSSELLLEEKDEDTVSLIYLPDKNLQARDDSFIIQREKMVEEEKRIFYVAVTRARDYLILSGILPERENASRLRWLCEIMELKYEEDKITSPVSFEGWELLSGRQVDALWEEKSLAGRLFVPPAKEAEKSYTHLLAPCEEEEMVVKTVSKETTEDLLWHGEGAVVFGEVMHKILEKISRGELGWEAKEILPEAKRLLALAGVPQSDWELHEKGILRQMNCMAKRGVKEIVLPQANSFAEMPFVYAEDNTLYKGRVDRVIVKGDTVSVYDYKTYRVRKKEIPRLLDFYEREQMRIYRRAVSEIFPGKEVKSYLIFTASGEIYPLPYLDLGELKLPTG